MKNNEKQAFSLSVTIFVSCVIKLCQFALLKYIKCPLDVRIKSTLLKYILILFDLGKDIK